MHVAEVDGERREPVADDDPLLGPGGEPGHGEAVTQLVQADPAGTDRPALPEPAGQLHEGPDERRHRSTMTGEAWRRHLETYVALRRGVERRPPSSGRGQTGADAARQDARCGSPGRI